MKIYTKKGDGGMTALADGKPISKNDERIELLGAIDELSSYLGLAKSISDDSIKNKLSQLQCELTTIMAGIADPKNSEFFIKEEQILTLESEIDGLENKASRDKCFVLYGSSELSARLDVARAVSRRAERHFYNVAKKHETDKNALIYMNRLSDYLYMLARIND